MSYLVFCSFEVGGLPFKMAETLNQQGIKTYYISLDQIHQGHNSTDFHYKRGQEKWDLSSLFDKGRRDSKKDIKALIRIKSRYNITTCLATGHKACLLRQAKIKYAYWCFGSDLDQYCRFPFFPATYPILKRWIRRLFYPCLLPSPYEEYRKSIIEANSLMIAPYQLKSYQQLRFSKRLFLLPQLVNVMDYEDLCIKKSESKSKICNAIGAENFFFSSTRHVWQGKNNLLSDYKGNDIILRSFARYLEISSDKGSRLILVRKGPDVKESEDLIQELGIDDYIVWVDEMKRDSLWVYYEGASICLGQFGTPVLTFAAVEPLSRATPCVSFFGDVNGDVPFYGMIPPVFNSNNHEEIADFMEKIRTDTGYASDASYRSWLWAKENCSAEKFAEAFLKEMSLLNDV